MLRSASAHDSCQNCTGSIRISRLVGCDPTLPADMQDFHDQDVRAGAELLGPNELPQFPLQAEYSGSSSVVIMGIDKG